jgi:putative transposase
VRELGKIKFSKEIYCQFLLASQKEFSATTLASLKSEISHDKVSRWLHNTKLTPKLLWEKVEGLVDKGSGFLLLDDSVLAKPYSQKIELTKWQYSGNVHGLTKGINLISLLWTGDGNLNEHLPVDFRLYSKLTDGKTKNDHFRDMVLLSVHRKLNPKAYVFDTWYSSVANLKWLNKLNLTWVTWLRKNRIVDHGEHISDKEIPDSGLTVHLKATGFVKVFKIVHPKTGDIEYLATNDLSISLMDTKQVAVHRWSIEEYHRGLKQTVGVENCQSRNQRSQRTHIFCSLLAFVALEVKRLKTGVTWYQSKRDIIQSAMSHYLEKPSISLNFT